MFLYNNASYAYKQWNNFINNLPFDGSEKPPRFIFESWRRCREYGVDPYVKKVSSIRKGSDLNKLLENNRGLINISLPYMETLHSYVRGSGFSVGLSDNQNNILHVVGDEDIMNDHERGGYVIGSNWSERSMGTTAFSIPMIENRPLQVNASEHYCKICHPYTGVGSPIHDASGALIGAIVMVAFYDRVNPHTLGMIVAATHAIENEIRLQKIMTDLTDSYDFQHSIFESFSEAHIVMSNEKIVMTVNEKAKSILRLPDKIVGIKLQDVFPEKENQDFINDLHKDNLMIDKDCTIYRDGEYKKFTVNTLQINSVSKRMPLGKIITLREMALTHNLVTRSIGANANFEFHDIVGTDPKFLDNIGLAKRAAGSTSNVLLLGESGTGKDIFAQAIHNGSSRRNKPYIAVNAGAIPRELITSELFGYSEGAFTGSKKGGNPGKFELAHCGTIFLDEIGEMPFESQIALLRVIEEKKVTRIGSKISTPVDVRIMAATNKNLREEVNKGKFREDLYYRLNVFTIKIIPLRDKVGDIPLLLESILKRLNASFNTRINRVDEATMKIFKEYKWPGNIRELQNVVERMLLVAPGRLLTSNLVPSEIVSSRIYSSELQNTSLKEMEQEKILSILQTSRTKVEAAKKLNIARSTLYLKMKQYKLQS
jgi:transcriptional regulator of acetoin/glycerol metabolism